LEEREQELRAYLLEHPDDRIGTEHVAAISEQQRKRVNLKALADEIGASLLARQRRSRRRRKQGRVLLRFEVDDFLDGGRPPR
jgi:hypothetical protein